jgi:hypothetical protein
MASTIGNVVMDLATENQVVVAIVAAKADINAMQAGTATRTKLNVTGGVATSTALAGTISAGTGLLTTEALTTAAAGTAVFVITNTLAAAGDVVLVQRQGGTSTTGSLETSAVCTAGVITLTLTNRHASVAFNGTFIFGFLLVKQA